MAALAGIQMDSYCPARHGQPSLEADRTSNVAGAIQGILGPGLRSGTDHDKAIASINGEVMKYGDQDLANAAMAAI
jgi:hypothetical protein